jgi:hypothetical protein
MVWLTWRQHRAEGLGGLLALAAVAAILLALGLPMHHSFTSNGVGPCAAQTNPTQSCIEVVKQFTDRYVNGGAGSLLPWLNFLPALIGTFVGAPLLAREFEQGTWRLAWTQAVPRTRWLAVKLVLLTLCAIVLAIAFTVMFTWYRGPLDQMRGRMVGEGFDFEGLVIPAYALFAFALGTLAGILTRRIVTAMAITLGGFVAVRLPSEYWLRPHYQAPVTKIADSSDAQFAGLELSRHMLDPSGRVLSDLQERGVVNNAMQSLRSLTPNSLNAYLRDHGYRWRLVFQPESRFWHFQLIEAAIFAGLAAILLAAAIWQLRRRVG